MYWAPRHEGQIGVETRHHQLQPACKFPGKKVKFNPDENLGHDEADDEADNCMDACILAIHGQPGFEDALMYLEKHHRQKLANWKAQHYFTMWEATRPLDLPG